MSHEPDPVHRALIEQGPAVVVMSKEDALRLFDARIERDRLKEMVRTLMTNEPDDIVSDCGIDVMTIWRHDAERFFSIEELDAIRATAAAGYTSLYDRRDELAAMLARERRDAVLAAMQWGSGFNYVLARRQAIEEAFNLATGDSLAARAKAAAADLTRRGSRASSDTVLRAVGRRGKPPA